MTNYEIADHFSLLSKLLDIHGDNGFKSKSYSIAAYNIERLPAEAATMSDAELFSAKGIGDSTGKKIRELINTGKLGALETVLATTPPGILEILEIKGLGPKKIAVIWKELGIETVGELEYACNENRLAQLKGFGAKTQDSVLQNIAFLRQNQGHYLWAQVEHLSETLLAQLRQAFPSNKVAITGAVRRQNETVEFVEIVTDAAKAAIEKVFEHLPDTLINEEPNERLLVHVPGQPKVRFHLTTSSSFYHTLFLTTGSEEFIDAFNKNYNLPATPASEEEIFSANGLPYVEPMMRETAGILTKAKESKLGNLIQPNDIRGIIHSHSTWSDGMNTIEQMAKAARDQGLEYLVISDHSQSAYYAKGLTPEQIAAQHQEVDALNAKLAPFKIFKSIEADILGDGSLDYSDSVLRTFDIVIASVHSNLKMTQEKAMERVLNAIRNPYTNILGHPTGRLLLSRKGYPLDHKVLIEECARHNVVIEINAHPRRLDIDWRWIEYAMECGVLLSIDPDAHSIEGFRDTYYGVKIAQKGGLTAQQNLSSFRLPQFEDFVKAQQAKRR